MRIEALAFVDKSDKPKLRMANKSEFVFKLGESFKDFEKVLVTVETFKDVRTLPQNARMHVYFDKIAKYTGQDKDQVKAALKFKFLTRALKDRDGNEVVDEDTGEVMTYIESTKKLNEAEADEFLGQIYVWALDFLKLDVTLRLKN